MAHRKLPSGEGESAPSAPRFAAVLSPSGVGRLYHRSPGFGIMRAEGVFLPTLLDPKVFDTLGKSPRSRAADHPWAVFPDTDDLPGVRVHP
jgi:hypothetical protein